MVSNAIPVTLAAVITELSGAQPSAADPPTLAGIATQLRGLRLVKRRIHEFLHTGQAARAAAVCDELGEFQARLAEQIASAGEGFTIADARELLDKHGGCGVGCTHFQAGLDVTVARPTDKAPRWNGLGGCGLTDGQR